MPPVFSDRLIGILFRGGRRSAVMAATTALALAATAAACAQAVDQTDPQAQSRAAAVMPLPSFAPLVDKVMPAAVSVAVMEKPEPEEEGEEAQQPSLEDFLRRFFERRGEHGLPVIPHLRRIALGSGFLIDPAGYIVTNDHVVANARKITVLLQNKSEHAARLIGRDALTDLALLKIDAAEPLPSVPWGDSNAARVGDWVMAVGNPFGLGGTVSFGIISARGRDIQSSPYDDLLQIDASLNRGNSGGPTFNLAGEVIGINTAIYTPSGGSVGVGFAIPSSRAKPVIEQLRQSGKIVRGWLGVEIQEVTPELAKALRLPSASGALVAGAASGGPAARAGIQPGDVILSFNGHAIASAQDLPLLTAEAPPGREAALELWRAGKPLSLHVAIGQMPEKTEAAASREERARPEARTSALGLSLAPLTDELRQRLHLSRNITGAVVADVADDSPFAELDLQAGDVIQSIDHQAVTTPKQAAELLKKVRVGTTVLLLIDRQGSDRYLAFSPGRQGAGSGG
ncbi:MAG TPA: Do family serine endopeptidase [Stellaceae bacterium]|nr:Do family serine endopeptidase [Stellaceae bacterium]